MLTASDVRFESINKFDLAVDFQIEPESHDYSKTSTHQTNARAYQDAGCEV